MALVQYCAPREILRNKVVQIRAVVRDLNGINQQ